MRIKNGNSVCHSILTYSWWDCNRRIKTACRGGKKHTTGGGIFKNGAFKWRWTPFGTVFS
jgi:hypothetical protein